MGTKTLMTLAEFERLPETEPCELDEGELIPMTYASDEHGEVQVNIAALLRDWARRTGAGRVLTNTGYVLSEDPATVRGPDVSFMKAPAQRTGKWPHRAPDLAVEVASPSNTAPEMARKVRQYIDAGAHTVWVVYPSERVVHVFQRSGGRGMLRENDILDAPELLPGFSVPVSALFE